MKTREERKVLDSELAKAYLASLDETMQKRVVRAYADTMQTGDLPTDPILKHHCVWLFLTLFRPLFKATTNPERKN